MVSYATQSKHAWRDSVLAEVLIARNETHVYFTAVMFSFFAWVRTAEGTEEEDWDVDTVLDFLLSWRTSKNPLLPQTSDVVRSSRASAAGGARPAVPVDRPATTRAKPVPRAPSATAPVKSVKKNDKDGGAGVVRAFVTAADPLDARPPALLWSDGAAPPDDARPEPPVIEARCCFACHVEPPVDAHRTWPCGHIFCATCLNAAVKAAGQRCPTCGAFFAHAVPVQASSRVAPTLEVTTVPARGDVLAKLEEARAHTRQLHALLAEHGIPVPPMFVVTGQSADELKEKGNQHFRQERYLLAKRCYSAALRLQASGVLYSNRGECNDCAPWLRERERNDYGLTEIVTDSCGLSEAGQPPQSHCRLPRRPRVSGWRTMRFTCFDSGDLVQVESKYAKGFVPAGHEPRGAGQA